MNNIRTLTTNEMAQATAGKGGINIPSRPIVNIISSIVCGGHNWVKTNQECERPYFIFWSKHQHLCICSKCGEKRWIDD